MALQTCILNLNASQKQLSSHGTLSFPCAGYAENANDWPNGTIPWHWHDELEIIHVVSGVLKLQIPANTYVLFAGDCIAINSGVLHSAYFDETCEIHSLVFSPLLIGGSSDSIYSKKYVNPITSCQAFRAFQFDKINQNEAIEAFITCFDAILQEPSGFEFTVREKLSNLCYAIYLQLEEILAAGKTALNQDDLRIRKMLDFIQDNFSSNITLNEISRAADIGQRECMRCFARTIQLSPMQYLIKYRMMRGAEVLCDNPDANISEIATACGFDSPSNFSKLFKRYYNCTPREYRVKILTLAGERKSAQDVV